MLTTSRLLAASLAFVTVLGTAAWAQQPPTVRIRGTIEAVDGAMLSIKSREGTDMKVRMTDNVAVFAVVKTEMSQIKEGSYIGVTALPEPDGTQKAVAVHIFPENQRGAAEGFRPWDQRPNSTMTNATVATTVKGTDGQNILVKYKDGEKKVVVPPDTPIVTFGLPRPLQCDFFCIGIFVMSLHVCLSLRQQRGKAIPATIPFASGPSTLCRRSRASRPEHQ